MLFLLIQLVTRPRLIEAYDVINDQQVITIKTYNADKNVHCERTYLIERDKNEH